MARLLTTTVTNAEGTTVTKGDECETLEFRAQMNAARREFEAKGWKIDKRVGMFYATRGDDTATVVMTRTGGTTK